MALSKTITTKHGITVKGAIIRVEQVAITGSRENIEFRVRLYTASDKPHFDERNIAAPYDIKGANPIKQAYEHLKTLPEFEGAVDC